MTEFISCSISKKLGDRAGIKLTMPESLDKYLKSDTLPAVLHSLVPMKRWLYWNVKHQQEKFLHRFWGITLFSIVANCLR